MDDQTQKRNERLAKELYPQPKKYSRSFWRISQLKTTAPKEEPVFTVDYRGIALLGVIIPIPFLIIEWVIVTLARDLLSAGDVLVAALVIWLFLTICSFVVFSFMKSVLAKFNTLGVADVTPLLVSYLGFILPVSICLHLLFGYEGLGVWVSDLLTIISSSAVLATFAWLLYKKGALSSRRWLNVIGLVSLPYVLGLSYALMNL